MPVLDVTNKLIVNYDARKWCTLPYPGHSKGCPNFGRKSSCPPQAPLIADWLKSGGGCLRLVYVSFDLQAHADRMLTAHPSWSERQARCLLYWQSKVNKRLESEVLHFTTVGISEVSYCPEAMGVDVMSTAGLAGIPIEVRPKKIVHKIALLKDK